MFQVLCFGICCSFTTWTNLVPLRFPDAQQDFRLRNGQCLSQELCPLFVFFCVSSLVSCYSDLLLLLFLRRPSITVFGRCLLCHVEGNKESEQDQSWGPGQGLTYVLLAVVNNCSTFRPRGPTIVSIILTASSCSLLAGVFISSWKTQSTDWLNGDGPPRWRRNAGSRFLWDWRFNQTVNHYSWCFERPQIW